MEQCTHAGRQIGEVQIMSDSGEQVGTKYFWYCDECRWGWETQDAQATVGGMIWKQNSKSQQNR